MLALAAIPRPPRARVDAAGRSRHPTQPVRSDAQAFYVFDISRSMLAAPGRDRATRLDRAARAALRMRTALAGIPAGARVDDRPGAAARVPDRGRGGVRSRARAVAPPGQPALSRSRPGRDALRVARRAVGHERSSSRASSTASPSCSPTASRCPYYVADAARRSCRGPRDRLRHRSLRGRGRPRLDGGSGSPATSRRPGERADGGAARSITGGGHSTGRGRVGDRHGRGASRQGPRSRNEARPCASSRSRAGSRSHPCAARLRALAPESR